MGGLVSDDGHYYSKMITAVIIKLQWLCIITKSRILILTFGVVGDCNFGFFMTFFHILLKLFDFYFILRYIYEVVDSQCVGFLQ